jgi:hypothetical protein
VAYFTYYPSMHLEGLRKTTNSSQESLLPGIPLPKYKSKSVTPTSTARISILIINYQNIDKTNHNCLNLIKF